MGNWTPFWCYDKYVCPLIFCWYHLDAERCKLPIVSYTWNSEGLLNGYALTDYCEREDCPVSFNLSEYCLTCLRIPNRPILLLWPILRLRPILVLRFRCSHTDVTTIITITVFIAMNSTFSVWERCSFSCSCRSHSRSRCCRCRCRHYLLRFCIIYILQFPLYNIFTFPNSS